MKDRLIAGLNRSRHGSKLEVSAIQITTLALTVRCYTYVRHISHLII